MKSFFEEDEVVTVECPLCCYSVSSTDVWSAESKVDKHMADRHPETLRSDAPRITTL
jgi:Zn ribbon nucleic-acid-binding protein